MPNRKKHKSTQPAQYQEHKESAGSNPQAADGRHPKDDALVQLTPVVKRLEETYTKAQKENDAQQRKHLRTQRVLCVIAFMTFIAAAIYAGISYNQWHDLRHNFETDQRAWIWVTDFNMTNAPKIGELIGINVAFKNGGKTPALGLRIHRYAAFGKQAAYVGRQIGRAHV